MQFSKEQHNKIWKLWIAVMAVILVVCILINHFAFTNIAKDNNLSDYQHIKLTTADTQIDYSNAKTVNLNDCNLEYVITSGGQYILSGNLNGQVKIDAEEHIVHLILDNAEIDAIDGPAINISSAGKVIITLMEDSINTLSDNAVYTQYTEEDACIYSECDLTINGNGILNVHGYYKDAVHSKDILKILGGSIYVQSKRDGLHGNDGIVISCPQIDVQSERHGLHSTKSGKVSKGNIEILSGEHSIIAGNYAISCITDLYIADCSLYSIGVIGNFNVSGISFISEGSLSDA